MLSFTGQIDGTTFFNLLMITLVELAAVFWVGAQLWLNFILQPASERGTFEEEKSINEQVERRFERRFSLPTLLILLLANLGVLLGQAVNLTGGNWGRALSPILLAQLTVRSRFDIFWLVGEVVTLLAIAVALYMLLAQRRSKLVDTLLPLANLLLGTALLIAITMSSHAASVTSSLVPLAIVLDWLHLLASALWVGGIFYIATIYLPVLKKQGTVTTARSLTRILPYFSILAIVGIIILSITGPFSADFHLNSPAQLTGTAYGRALLVKIVLVGILLITSAIHIGILQPRVKKEYKKYIHAAARLAVVIEEQETAPAAVTAEQDLLARAELSGTDRPAKQLTQQVRLREQRLTKKTGRLVSLLRWEPLLGVAIIVCVGLLNVFGGTLTPTTAAQPSSKHPQGFTTTVRTQDGKFNTTLDVNPNSFGTNIFTVSVVDNATGKPVTNNIGVVLFTTMLDMDMGTDSVMLLPDGKGHFSAQGDLSMGGNWQIRIQIRTPDGVSHIATVHLVTSD